MAAEVIWTDKAIHDIENIRSEVGSEVIREIFQAIHTMSFHIWDGKVVPEFGIHSLREFSVSNYLVFYQILILPERWKSSQFIINRLGIEKSNTAFLPFLDSYDKYTLVGFKQK